ncbi:FAD:protein FMN transferase [Streptomyces sp. NPDC092369]|uniref:FAD:protein FMN transferase n=1 Tax=Streptomyces sp. NPDC092369 TaxID=3366015 RepID=UPI0038041FB7
MTAAPHATPHTAPRTTAAAEWRALGTGVRLVVTAPALLDSCNLLLARLLAEVDAACSRFRADSELAALDTTDGRPVRVSPLLAQALEVALRAAEMTDGTVDPTVGSAMDAIGYDRDFTLVQEDDRPVRLTVKRAPGWRTVRLDRTTDTVTVPAGVRLDLGATAKAWAADRAATMLAEAAGCGVLVSLGGDTAVAGESPAGGWQIRVQDVTGAVDETPAQGPYATVGLHSGGLSLSAMAFLTLHIAFAVIDSYVDITVVDVVVPFASNYQPLWLGLGTVALDLMLAVVVTSLLRARMGHRAWRAVHWLAYASWPVALVHGIGIGTDTGADWMTWLTVSCVAAVVAAVGIRLAHSARAARRTPAALLRTAEGARS